MTDGHVLYLFYILSLYHSKLLFVVDDKYKSLIIFSQCNKTILFQSTNTKK